MNKGFCDEQLVGKRQIYSPTTHHLLFKVPRSTSETTDQSFGTCKSQKEVVNYDQAHRIFSTICIELTFLYKKP
jgi:hypothetical protein